MRRVLRAVMLLMAALFTVGEPAGAQGTRPPAPRIARLAGLPPALRPSPRAPLPAAGHAASLEAHRPAIGPAGPRRSRWLLGAVIGAAIGATGGILLESGACSGSGDRPACVAHGYLYFGLIGGGIGGLLGAAIGA